nr:PREDICTED: uncharacterized protein LOC108192378 [Daucus carota subsp. sativus]
MADSNSYSQGNKEPVEFKGKDIKRSAELEQNKIDGRWRYWLEQRVDSRLAKTEDLQNLVSVFSMRDKNEDNEPGVKQMRSRNVHKQSHNAEHEMPTRRSIHHRKQHSTGDAWIFY